MVRVVVEAERLPSPLRVEVERTRLFVRLQEKALWNAMESAKALKALGNESKMQIHHDLHPNHFQILRPFANRSLREDAH
jgi:hypothetical protein